MNILSLFDWISCGRVALDRAWIKVDKYYASEIDKYAIQVSQKNYHDIVQLWDVTKRKERDINRWEIDLLLAWFPCQAWSIAWKMWWVDDERWALMFTMLDILHHIQSINPKIKFLFENVKMKKEFLNFVNEKIWVQPILINSALVSAQNRNRFYRTNIEWIEQPNDKWIKLKDILEDKVDDKYYINITEKTWYKWLCDILEKSNILTSTMYKWYWNDWVSLIFLWWINTKKDIVWDWKWYSRNVPQWQRVYDIEWKSSTLSALWWWQGEKTWLYLIQKWRWYNKWWIHKDKSPTLSINSWEQNNMLSDWNLIRKLTPLECERLQTLDDNYTEGISNSQRYKCIWNGWTVDVIVHIFDKLK